MSVKSGTEWSTIDTAPKDGTKIAVWDTRAGYVPWVRWTDDGWCSDFIRWGGNPTHWMPLPKAPLTTEAVG